MHFDVRLNYYGGSQASYKTHPSEQVKLGKEQGHLDQQERAWSQCFHIEIKSNKLPKFTKIKIRRGHSMHFDVRLNYYGGSQASYKTHPNLINNKFLHSCNLCMWKTNRYFENGEQVTLT